LNRLTLLHHVSCAKKWLIWFYVYYFVRFPDNGTLRAEILGILFGIIAEISKEYVYAFFVVN